MATDTVDTRQTLNRQYAMMQKIMMPAKPWCDHTEGFESGLRSWELDVGEWERASGTTLADAVKYTVMMNMAPISLRNSLQLGTYANSTALRAALLQWCYTLEILERIRPRHMEMERQMMTRCKLTLSRKVRERAKVKNQYQRGNRTTSTTNTSSTDINMCKNCGKPGDWAKDCWNRATIPPTEILAKARVNTQAKGKSNMWTL